MRSPSKPSKILLAETTPIQLSGDDIRRSTGTKKMNERSPAPSTSPPSMNTFVKSLTPYDWSRDDFARWEKDRLSISSSSSSSKEIQSHAPSIHREERKLLQAYQYFFELSRWKEGFLLHPHLHGKSLPSATWKTSSGQSSDAIVGWRRAGAGM